MLAIVIACILFKPVANIIINNTQIDDDLEKSIKNIIVKPEDGNETKEEIEDIMDKQNKNPETRIAQKTLAYEVVKDIHGKDEADHAIKISEVLFTGNIKDLTDKEIEIVFKKMPAFESNNDTLINILVNNNIATSRREAREFLSNNAITLDGDIVNDESKEITNTQKYHIIRKGKKKYYLIKMNQD